MLGKLICWSIRKLGGQHNWRKLRKVEQAGLKLKACRWCKETRPVKSRKKEIA